MARMAQLMDGHMIQTKTNLINVYSRLFVLEF
uniref:Collagen alpha-5 chain-like protein isoform x1 n=1 Tax=Triatoma infestans TaxID=30076 RepID=A0A171ANZ7_TRIIF